MKKRFLSALMMCVLVCTMLVGCGDTASDSGDKGEKDKDVAIGMLSGLNISEQKFNAELKTLGVFTTDFHFIYYDNLNSMQMGLESGSIEEMSTYKSVANYLIARKPELTITDENKFKVQLIDKFCCAVKSDNKQLLDELNVAIEGMRGDGTLDTFVKQYITDLGGAEPEPVAMPTFDGADTIKVAVTGDLPPLDLIRADGTPAGFNTAVLAEIGKRINKNIELVSVDSVARASALSSDKVDVVFWVRVPNSSDFFPAGFDRPNGIETTAPYFEDEIVHVAKK